MTIAFFGYKERWVAVYQGVAVVMQFLLSCRFILEA